MRPDDINPRTGLVVALVSVFLVFGFMFTVSGIKGETLGDIPLLAIGPAICLPGIAAIAWTRKTDGCTKWPEHRCCPPCACCCRKKTRDKDALELLRTPSDLESGKGSCDQLASRVANGEASTGAAITTITNVLEGRGLGAPPQEEMLRYLENCYPEMPGNVFVAEAGPYSAFQEPRESPSVLEKRAAAITVVHKEEEEEEEEDMVAAVVAPSDTIIVCSYKDTSPYERYCCYVNPSEELCSDHEAAIV